MKRKLKSLAALAMSAAMVLSMAACGSGDGSAASAASAASEAGSTAAAQTEAAGDQHLNILLGGTVNNLDPDASSWTGEYQIVTQSQASLLRIVTDDYD